MIPPSESGIDFSNTLHQTDTFNILFFEFFYNGSGLAAGDINNDGLVDLFFGSNMESSKLFLNKRDLKFEDITKETGIDTKGKWVTGVNMIDVNADGWLDIYLCVGGNIADDYRNLLYISNGDSSNLQFIESAHQVNLDDNGYSTQAAFLDYDLDGDLDIYLVTSAMNIPNKNRIRERKGDGSMTNTDRLYRNDGLDPTTKLPIYTNVSSAAGITWSGFGLGVCVSDINRDGWPDIYVANDYISKDLLYINKQDGTFEEAVDSFFSHLSYSAMGADMADINNDGLIDLIAVDMLPPDQFRKRIMAGSGRSYNRYQMEKAAGYSEQYIRNTLQLNNGNNTFSEIGQLAGIHQTDWSWSPLLADFDNDGLKDLFIGNGIPHDITNMDFVSYQASKFRNSNTAFAEQYRDLIRELDTKGNVKIPNYLFRNIDGIQFADSSAAWGFTEPSQSNSSVYADLDNDGDLDLAINNTNQEAFLYENNLNTLKNSTHHFLQIKLDGPDVNRQGIGARIRIKDSIREQTIEHYPVRGFLSSINCMIHFGLGEENTIDQLEIWWPDGRWQKINQLSANQIINISYEDAQERDGSEHLIEQKKMLFTNVTSILGLHYEHAERNFNDFSIQPLIPHQYSREGPGIAVADINNDGLDDFYVGGSTSYSGQIFLQSKYGKFTTQQLPGDHNYEDMGSLFF
ncbi:MAG: CRTAC1 family protein [Saprospiraceae bacterium]|nr:CRTAC1 family protein [Saprospiraceae bacterium]